MCSCLNVRQLLFGSKNSTAHETTELEETSKIIAESSEKYDNKKNSNEQEFKDKDDNNDNAKNNETAETKVTKIINNNDYHHTNKNIDGDVGVDIDDIPHYIEEYRTFVEKPCTTSSTPLVDGFDFEKWFNSNHQIPTVRKRHASGGEESEYTQKAAAEHDDTVTPLLSDHRPTRPVTLPQGGFSLEVDSDGLEEGDISVLTNVKSSNRLLLMQRHSRSHGRLNQQQQQLMRRHALENNFMLQQTQSNLEYWFNSTPSDDDVDEEMVVLRHNNYYADHSRSKSLYERRQPKGPKLKLRLKTSLSYDNFEQIKCNMEFQVKLQSIE